jgi:multiple antibiotic resistance protein
MTIPPRTSRAPGYVAGIVGLVSLVMMVILSAIPAYALAASTGNSFRTKASSADLDLGEALTFFFLMLGPIKILGPFVKMTERADYRFCRQLAIRATVVSSLALLIAVLVGETSLRNYGVSLNVLALTGGSILSAVAFRQILEQFQPTVSEEGITEPSPLAVATLRLAFPTILPPYGIAAVIIFTAIASDVRTKIVATSLALGVLLLDLLAMLIARPLLKWLGAPLLILGVVLAIIQLAVGVQIMLSNLSAIGVFALRSQ